MHRQDAVAFVDKLFSHLNQRDYQQAARYLADDVTLTGAEPAVLAGRDAVIRHFQQSDAALADSALAVADVLAGGTKVGVQLVLTGTHTGSFDMGPGKGVVPASGKHAAIPVFWIMTVEDGLITSVTHYWDMFRLLTVLGLSPTPADGAATDAGDA